MIRSIDEILYLVIHGIDPWAQVLILEEIAIVVVGWRNILRIFFLLPCQETISHFVVRFQVPPLPRLPYHCLRSKEEGQETFVVKILVIGK
jgi:hypothetical protein